MWDFIAANKQMVWIVTVIIGVLFFRLLTILIFTYLIKKNSNKGASAVETLTLLKNLIVGFLYIVGIILISYAFFDQTVYETLNKNLLTVIWIALVGISTIIGAAVSKMYFKRKIVQTSYLDKNDPTTYKFLNYLVTTLIYFVGICLAAIAIPPLRSLAQSALAGAGVLALIGGFAAQEAMANLVGGLFIVFSKPFRIGDCIRVGENLIGIVEDLTLRHTVINDFNNKRIVIPNAIINKEYITNYNLGENRICEWIKIGVSYDSDVDQALAIMIEEASKHPSCVRPGGIGKPDQPKVVAKVTDLGDSSVNLRAWVWAKDYVSAVNMRHDLYKSIKERFDKADIEIPFPYRTVVIKNTTPKPVEATDLVAAS